MATSAPAVRDTPASAIQRRGARTGDRGPAKAGHYRNTASPTSELPRRHEAWRALRARRGLTVESGDAAAAGAVDDVEEHDPERGEDDWQHLAVDPKLEDEPDQEHADDEDGNGPQRPAQVRIADALVPDDDRHPEASPRAERDHRFQRPLHQRGEIDFQLELVEAVSHPAIVGVDHPQRGL